MVLRSFMHPTTQLMPVLRLAHSPVDPGVDAAASGAALKAWVAAQFHAEHEHAEVEPNTGVFHQLELDEIARVQNRYVRYRCVQMNINAVIIGISSCTCLRSIHTYTVYVCAHKTSLALEPKLNYKL
jgi:hypothetical protein